MFCNNNNNLNDIYDTIKPIFLISKLLGLAPFKLVGTPGNRQYEAGAIGLGVFRILLIIGMMGYIGYLTEQTVQTGDIQGLSTRAELYLGAIMTTVVLVFTVVRQNTLIASLKRITKIDNQFKQFGIKISYRNAQRFASVQILISSVIFVIKGILQAFNDFIFVLIYSALNIVDYINTVMILQYIDSILLLRQRFIWLNRKLDTITGVSLDAKQRSREGSFKMHVMSNIKEKKILEFQSSIAPEEIPTIDSTLKKDTPIHTLQTIGKLHDQMCDISKMLNSAFSVQILVTMAVRFIMTTAQLINIYKIASDPEKTFSDSISTLCLTFLYLFLHTVKMFLIAAASAVTENQARNTGVLLHKIWNNDPEIKNYVKYFSLQMLHQNVKFSAAGFFELDYSFVYAVCGAVTTYLVILIQFDLSRQDELPKPCIPENITITEGYIVTT